MGSQNASSKKAHPGQVISLILIGVSLVAIAWGLMVLIGQGGAKGGSVAALLCVVFGFCGLVVGVVLYFILRSQRRLFDKITSSDHPVLLRWTCTTDEASQFIAAEAARLKISQNATLYFGLVMVALGLGIAYIQRENFEWGSFLIGYAIVGGIAAFCYFYWRAINSAELRAAKQRAHAEVIIDTEGLVTGASAFKWRGFNWGLEKATYESGQPDVLNLVFLAGTIPGSETLGTLRTAAWLAGATSSAGGSTQQRTSVRIPVTASKADEMRELLSTTIAPHIFTPSVIP
jgi:hypothetical protein